MGRPAAKEIPQSVRAILDYVNNEGEPGNPDGHFRPLKPHILEHTRGFMRTLIDVTANPLGEYSVAIQMWHRLIEEDGYLVLTPLMDEHPIMRQVLRLPIEQIKRILFCPGCKRFVWRKKLDAKTCGAKECVAKLNNERRRRVPNPQEEFKALTEIVETEIFGPQEVKRGKR